RIPVPSRCGPHRHRGGGRPGHRAGPLHPSVPAEPRRPDDAVPQHVVDVPRHDGRRRRPPHGGLRPGRRGADDVARLFSALPCVVLARSTPSVERSALRSPWGGSLMPYRKRTVPAAAIIVAISLLGVSPAYASQITPKKIIGGPTDQFNPGANATWIGWSENSIDNPKHYDAFV